MTDRSKNLGKYLHPAKKKSRAVDVGRSEDDMSAKSSGRINLKKTPNKTPAVILKDQKVRRG